MSMRAFVASLELDLLSQYRRYVRNLRVIWLQKFLTRSVSLSVAQPTMNVVDLQSRLVGLVAILLVLGIGRLGPEPSARSPVSADEFIRAVGAHRTSLIDFYLREHLDPNARGEHDCP